VADGGRMPAGWVDQSGGMVGWHDHGPGRGSEWVGAARAGSKKNMIAGATEHILYNGEHSAHNGHCDGAGTGAIECRGRSAEREGE